MDYYQPQGFALDIFQKRYALHDIETFLEGCDRVANHVASAEDGPKIVQFRHEFAEVLKKNLFMPGGRIWYGSGRPKGQLLNCFVIPTGDSREWWGETSKNMIIISGMGGGIGINFSPVRPRGSDITGQKGKATGAVSLMEIINSSGNVLKAGGGRRVALMFCLGLAHGDIVEFLDKKLDLKQLNNANVSVVFDENPEDFFDKVKKDEMLEFKFQGRVVGSARAKEIWQKIVKNALKGGEPGLLNGYLANRMNNVWYHTPLVSTNPCVTGDTLIATADGRNAVSIKQLCEEGKDVPVYSTNLKTGQVEIKMGRNPRVTGIKKEVWKLTLDDGSIFRATPNHKIMLLDRSYVELKDLKPGMSIFPFNSFNSNGYRQIRNTGKIMKGGARRNRRQYRLIHEFYNGVIDAKKFAIHHVNRDSTDDRIENLQILTHEEHQNLHAKEMMGDKNPYHRMSSEWKEKFAAHSGESNGRFSGHSNEEILDEGRALFLKNGKLTQEIWIEHAKKTGFPQFLGNDFRFGSFSNFKNQVAENHRVVSVEFDSYEDVYNITVDDNHNYHVLTSGDEKYITSSGICVKNCGEIWLAPYDCCDLGALVLPRFVTGKDIDWDLLKQTVRTAVRFLDDVLTVNNYPIPEIKETCHTIRRIGLGVMGLHDMLLMMGLKYASAEGLEMIDKVMNFIKNVAYEMSTELALEKGPFPAFDAEKFLKSGFAKTLKPSIRALIRERGMRNCALLTIAPTGTTSLVCGVSSGIEPLYAPVAIRTYFDNDDLRQEVIVHPLFQKFIDEGKGVRHFQGAYDLKLRDHFEVQRACQKHIDNAVSKTINVLPGTSEEELSELYMEYFPELKGVTIYPEGSRENQPLTPVPTNDAIKLVKEGNLTLEALGLDACKDGKCDI